MLKWKFRKVRQPAQGTTGGKAHIGSWIYLITPNTLFFFFYISSHTDLLLLEIILCHVFSLQKYYKNSLYINTLYINIILIAL